MVISIFKFLSNYYGIKLDKTTKVSHKDIRSCFDFVEMPSDKKRSNEAALNNSIVYVEDSYGKVDVYVCPEDIEVVEVEVETTEEKITQALNNSAIDLNLADKYVFSDGKLNATEIDEEDVKKIVENSELKQISSYELEGTKLTVHIGQLSVEYEVVVFNDVNDDTDLLDDLCDLPTYQLGELLSKYKRKPSFYRLIKKELVKRGVYKNKKYKLDKEIVEMEVDKEFIKKEGAMTGYDRYTRRREIKRKKS